MDIKSVLDQMIVLLLIMVAGFALGKAKVINEDANRFLSKLVIDVFQSAVILASIMNVVPSLGTVELFILMGTSLATYAILIGLSFLSPFVLFSWKKDAGVYRFMTIFGNVAFIGFPVVTALYGSEAVFYASLFNIPFTIIVFTLGVIMLAGEGGAGKLRFKDIMNAPLVATIVALIFFVFKIPVPAQLYNSISMLGSAAFPVGMLVLGSSLSRMELRDVVGDWRAYVMALIKLIAAPVVVWAIIRLFIHNEVILGIAVILCAMPIATIATMLCIRYNGNEHAASKSVLISTVMSAVTIPLVAYMLL